MGIKASSNRIGCIKKSASTLSLNATPSTPTSPLDIEVEHLETFTLVWLDTQIDEDEQNSSLKKRLRQYVTYLVTFDDLKSCEQWLKNRPNDDKILLLVPGELGKKIVPNIHQLTSIIGIYVFCWRPEIHTVWTSNYSKVRGVISKAGELIQQILKDQSYFENIELSKAIKIFQNRPHTCILDLDNTSFIYYQLFLEVLISSSYFPSSASPSELIQILRRYTSNDQEGLNLIKDFEQTYDKQKAITWLTNNTPLARFINKALREQNISLLFYLRFFLIDISNQLINHQLQSAHVYRKQIMSPTNIENIRANINNYLMVNNFLYTSRQPFELSSIDTNDNRFQTVFIEIHAEHQDETVPFAYVQNTGNDQNDSGVLFMCGSIFKIISLTKNNNYSSWTLQLSLAGNKDINILYDKKQKLRKNKDLLMIVDLLDQCNQSNKANVYCQHLLRELPSDHPLRSEIKEKLKPRAQPGMFSL
jgi:hypothetical protein